MKIPPNIRSVAATYAAIPTVTPSTLAKSGIRPKNVPCDADHDEDG